jgi:hypothetical protein
MNYDVIKLHLITGQRIASNFSFGSFE